MGYEIYWTNLETDRQTVYKTIEMIKLVIDHRHKIELTEHGFRFDAGHETFVYKSDNKASGCKTKGRFPYTEDIMKALIIMVEMGIAKKPFHDGDLTDFLEPLEQVSDIMILKTYEDQKKYFSSDFDGDEEYVGA